MIYLKSYTQDAVTQSSEPPSRRLVHKVHDMMGGGAGGVAAPLAFC